MQPLRALFVTDRFDAPYRYRCQHACEQLRAEGAIANVLHIDSSELPAAVSRYGVVVLYRLPFGNKVEALVRSARASGVPLVFDIDDLTFDGGLEALVPFRGRYTEAEWAREYGEPMKRLRATLDACDAFVGSTPELAEHAARLGKPAFVHPNVVHPYYLRLGGRLPALRALSASGPLIGYFSGSNTHDEDFAAITSAVLRVLERNRTARLLVVGYLEAASRGGLLEERLVRLPYMHWRDFAVAYSACRVTLAPLAVNNAFTASKSALKYFEAGAFGTPVIASPVREMARAIRDRENGFLATTEDEWIESLELALDPATLSRVGGAARRDVEEHHSYAAVRGSLGSILRGLAREVHGPPPGRTPLEMAGDGARPRSVERALRPLAAARDGLRIALAVSRAPRTGSLAEALEPLVTRLLHDPAARAQAVRRGALVLAARDLETFRRGEQVGGEGELPGESESLGDDPFLEGSLLETNEGPFRFVALRLRATATTPVTQARLYLKGQLEPSYTERQSLTLSYPADGMTTTRIVDLREAPRGKLWTRLRRGSRLRVDPTDRPGSFRVEGLVFLPSAAVDGWQLPGSAPSVASVKADAEPEDATRLGSRIDRLEQDHLLELELRGAPAKARAELRVILAEKGVVVESLRGSPGHAGTVSLLGRRAKGRVAGVDIVIPVYNRRELVLRCARSALRYAEGDHRVVVVNDASTDPEMGSALDALAATDPRVVVLTNPTNLGFLGTANRGMAHGAGRDVLLLNSDTEVFEGFLDGLRNAAYSAADVGLVSPVSNNATICSVPDFCVSNRLPAGTVAADVARIVRAISRRRYPELVTPHGFCLYLRRDCLDRVGPFDAALFGRGFGEENDLGERAKARGFRIVLADDVYVWHEGKASFGDEGRELERLHAKVLEERHPGYHGAVARFVEQNPLRPIQEAARRHLSRRSHDLRPAPLFVLHANPFAAVPGGVEHHVRDLVASLALPRAVLLYPGSGALQVAEIIDGDLEGPFVYSVPLSALPSRLCHEDAATEAAFAEVLDLFDIGWAHIHHLMFLPLSLGKVLAERRVPYLVTLHDFYLACPSFNLLDLSTVTACCPASCEDEGRRRTCQVALFAHLGEPPPRDPLAFRRRHVMLAQALIDGAQAAVFPSQSARDLTGQLLRLDQARSHVIPHDHYAPAHTAGRPAPQSRPGPLRVALLGQVAYPTKGAAAYLGAIARTAQADIEWHMFGEAELFGFAEKLRRLAPRGGVVFHGTYDRRSIVSRLTDADIDVGLLLPAWPETFSYTLSEFLAAGVPLVARRIGALTERLAGSGCAILVEGPDEAAEALARLASDRTLLETLARAVPPPVRPGASVAAHQRLHAACAVPPGGVMTPTRRPVVRYARLEELASLPEQALPPPVSVVRPDAALSSSPWYAHAERLKALAPETLRRLVRARLTGDRVRPVKTFRLPGRSATIEQQLTVDRRYLGTTRLVSHGSDPRILIQVAPFLPERVTLVRFDLWCSTATSVAAQLYWKHAGEAAFSERNSVTIPLDGRTRDWLEYTARLDRGKAADAWLTGGPIVALRFDPIDAPGPFIVGRLSLCAED